jgi:ribosome biogenesis GTPase
VPAVILFNKSDLYRQKEQEMFDAWEQTYTTIGYRVLSVSTVTGEGIEELRKLLQGKTTLMSGHSGVGKSTLINVLMPDLTLRTKAVSGWSGKGMHTTTFAEMYDLPGGGSIIDTPGVREFGLVDIGKDELSHYFPEMRLRIHDCQFNNCRHMNEPGCAVKSAVEEGAISIDRYISYCTLLDGISEGNR